MPAEIVIAALPELASRFAAIAEMQAREAIDLRGAFALAVSGGSAAELLLPAAAAAGIDWQRTHVFQVDERAVPPEAPDSNYRLLKTALLDPAHVPEANVHRMRAEAPDLVGAAADYAERMALMLGRPPRLDLVVLGMGPDGHVASLFPGHRLLRAWDRDVAVVEDSPKPPPRRMTLTLRVLTEARRMVVFASGRTKADAIQRALGDPESDLPIALATMGDGPVTYLLDPAAASEMSR